MYFTPARSPQHYLPVFRQRHVMDGLQACLRRCRARGSAPSGVQRNAGSCFCLVIQPFGKPLEQKQSLDGRWRPLPSAESPEGEEGSRRLYPNCIVTPLRAATWPQESNIFVGWYAEEELGETFSFDGNLMPTRVQCRSSAFNLVPSRHSDSNSQVVPNLHEIVGVGGQNIWQGGGENLIR